MEDNKDILNATLLPEIVILDIRDVSRTALLVNVWKNEGTYANKLNKKILYKDSFMKLFVDNKIAKEAEESLPDPKSRRAVQIRHKHVKKVLSYDLKSTNPPKQIIFLGSGLETLPEANKKWLNRGFPLRFFEIDKPSVLNFKHKVLSKNGYTPTSCYITIDYVKDDLIEFLRKAGVDFSLNTHFIWEGNTYYLEKEDVINILQKIKTAFVGSLSVTFDYFHEKVISKSTGSQVMNDLQDNFTSMGARFKTGFNDIKQLAEELGFNLLQNHTIPELDKIYVPDYEFEPEAEDHFYSICTMNK